MKWIVLWKEHAMLLCRDYQENLRKGSPLIGRIMKSIRKGKSVIQLDESGREREKVRVK